MVKIILIQKNGTVKETKISNFDNEKLYKKAGLKKIKDFKKRHSWKVNRDDVKYISVYAKDTGRATTENKFELFENMLEIFKNPYKENVNF